MNFVRTMELFQLWVDEFERIHCHVILDNLVVWGYTKVRFFINCPNFSKQRFEIS